MELQATTTLLDIGFVMNDNNQYREELEFFANGTCNYTEAYEPETITTKSLFTNLEKEPMS